MIKRDHSCQCGRGGPVIQGVTGRTVNLFLTKDGKKVDGEYFTHLFFGYDNIKQFQLIQEQYDEIHIKLSYLDQSIPLTEFQLNDISHKIRS